jgi:predicted phage baseplate assembly protein
MSWSGQVWLHLPVMVRREINGIETHWVRCEVTESKGEQRPYETSPLVREVNAASWGGTVPATHATEARSEPLGRSDGSPGQVFTLEHLPVLPRRPDERVEVWQNGMADWEPWQEVADFSASGAHDRHYTLDSASGEIRFGPALRQRDGSVRRYGTIPPRGAELRMACYRYGGGTPGNVRAGAIREPRRALAYVDRVINRAPAMGGLDQETLERAMFRARNLLRTRYRAVTPNDFEYLVLSGFPGEIARVRCLQTLATGGAGAAQPGVVYVVLIPALPEEEANRYIPLSRLALGEPLRQRVAALLDERRLLTTQVEVRAASYRRVRVEAQVVARPGADAQRLERAILAALERFINPLRGGPEGTGWPFGRELYISDLYACIQPVEGLLNVQEIQMAWMDERDQAHRAERRIDLMAHEVLVSDQHRIQIVSE